MTKDKWEGNIKFMEIWLSREGSFYGIYFKQSNSKDYSLINWNLNLTWNKELGKHTRGGHKISTLLAHSWKPFNIIQKFFLSFFKFSPPSSTCICHLYVFICVNNDIDLCFRYCETADINSSWSYISFKSAFFLSWKQIKVTGVSSGL